MPVQVERLDNCVSVRGELHRFDELRVVSAALYDTVERRGYRDVTLDFSACKALTQAAVLPLLPIVAGYREVSGATFELVEPEDDDLKRLCINANWAHYIDPERYSLNAQVAEQVPAQRFTTESEMDPIVASVMNLLLSRMNVERETLAALEWSMNEVMDNVLSHAQSATGGFVQATAYEQSQRVEFIVADGGIGIAQSMRIRDHEQALASAIAEGGTSDRATNMGNGLFGSFRIATLSDGQFEINSGFGLLHASHDGPDSYRTRKRRIRYGGTAIRCGVGVGDAGLLGRALVFGDRSYEPAHDYVERRFGGESGVLTFSIKDEVGQDLGSRSGGRRVRQIVENLLREDGGVVLDFADITVISSSFADEVMGRLFVELGPRSFMSRIQIQNANSTIEALIDRAILQRTRAG